MTGLPDDLSGMMERLQAVQEQFGRIQEEIAKLEATGEAGGGVVKARVNGKQQLIAISIDKEVIDPTDPEMLEDLVVAAVNRALDRSRELSESRMSEATRGMMPGGLPGF